MRQLIFMTLASLMLLSGIGLKLDVIAQIPKQSQIAFCSDRDGDFDIYTMDADGRNQWRVTNNPSWDGDPEWSPSGEKIVFMSERDGNKEIYVIDADGKNPHNLTENSAFDGSACWFDPAFAVPVSPSGKLR